MTDKINLTQLRKYQHIEAGIKPPGAESFNLTEAWLALIDTAEAAYVQVQMLSRPQRGKFPHQDRLRDTLARFDFGDPPTP